MAVMAITSNTTGQGAYHCAATTVGIGEGNVFPFQTMLDLYRIREYISHNRCRSLAILGGGYLAFKALECLYNFGLRINIIHAQNRICEGFDTDIAHCMQSELRQKPGVQLHLNVNVRTIARALTTDSGYAVILSNGSSVPADLVVLATDLTPWIQTVEDAHLHCRRGVLVNEFMQTSDPDIYAVGRIGGAAARARIFSSVSDSTCP